MRAARAFLALGLAAPFLLSGCRTTYITQVQDRDTLYQVAPLLYVLSGNYDGAITVNQFKAAGTLGIGTFDGLDGEAILIDSVVYQAKGDGSVVVPDASLHMPFGACTLFDSDQRRRMKHIPSFEAFAKTLENSFDNRQIFYAIRADGLFKSVRVRSCDKQEKPYRPLAEATRSQHEHTFENIKGSLVGFWSPPTLPGSIGVPGFHLHFISDDRSKGGHVLDLQSESLDITLDPTPRITVDFSTPVTVPLVGTNIEQQVRAAESGRR